jgi:hypothetical protein
VPFIWRSVTIQYCRLIPPSLDNSRHTSSYCHISSSGLAYDAPHAFTLRELTRDWRLACRLAMLPIIGEYSICKSRLPQLQGRSTWQQGRPRMGSRRPAWQWPHQHLEAAASSQPHLITWCRLHHSFLFSSSSLLVCSLVV